MPGKKPSKEQITHLSPPEKGSPMDKFNNATQKILSVPKRVVKKK
jgi:hypothetical protein